MSGARNWRTVAQELMETTAAKEAAAHSGEFDKAADLRDKERGLQKEWSSFTPDEIADGLRVKNLKNRRQYPCVRCGGACPRYATVRRLTVPIGVVQQDAFTVAHFPDHDSRTGWVYVTHFFMCLALDEPAFVGVPVVWRPPQPEVTATSMSTDANTSTLTASYIAPQPKPWWRRIFRHSGPSSGSRDG